MTAAAINYPVALGSYMRKILLHFLFWLSYYLWQVYVEYIMDARSIPNFTNAQMWAGAFTIESIILPIKMAASYLSFEVVRRSSLFRKGRQNHVQTILLILMILAVATILHRAASNYIAYPLELGRPVRVPFWEPVYQIGSAIDTLFIVMVFVGLNFVIYQSRGAKREVQLRKEKLESELHFLRSQINPHFLFNTLNNIYSLAIKKSALAPDAILKLSKLMRFLLYEGRVERISVDREIGLINDYISLEKMRFTDHRLTLQFIEKVDNKGALIAPFILLTFVENAFKHGASESECHTFISIQLNVSGNTLFFEIENTNHNNQADVSKNIGLTNIERQLNITYRDYQLEILPTGKIFSVKLKINLDSYGPDQMYNS